MNAKYFLYSIVVAYAASEIDFNVFMFMILMFCINDINVLDYNLGVENVHPINLKILVN